MEDQIVNKRVFLIVTLLLICVLIPLQRAAALSATAVDGTSQTTTTDATNNVVFKMRITSDANDRMNLQMFALNPKNLLDRTFASVVPSNLSINGAGTHDVTVTVTRATVAAKGLFRLIFAGRNAADQATAFTLNLSIQTIDTAEEFVGISLAAEGNTTLDVPADEVEDAAFTMIVTNSSTNVDLDIDLTVKDDHSYDTNVVNYLGSNVVNFTPSSLTLEADAEGKAKITFADNTFNLPGTYVTIIVATPNLGFAQEIILTVNVIPASGLQIESLAV